MRDNVPVPVRILPGDEVEEAGRGLVAAIDVGDVPEVEPSPDFVRVMMTPPISSSVGGSNRRFAPQR